MIRKRKSSMSTQQAAKLTRRQRERQRHRREILDAAIDLFAQKGFHNVSMHEIAEKAEFGIGTIYSFFENKEALYKALIMEYAEKFHTALCHALAEGKDEFEKIINFLRAKGEIFKEGIKIVRLYLAETRGVSFSFKEGLDEEIRELHEDTIKRLTKIFKSGTKKGLFAKINPYYLAVSLDSISNAFLLCWLGDTNKHDYFKNIPVMISIFFERVKLERGKP